jgi:SAM-dependent methyltransferase
MLKDIQDAYGHQLYDCYKGKNVVEVVERDDGFIGTSTIYPSYYLAAFKDWSPHEKKAMQYAKGRVLDIGCGGGKNALYLQRSRGLSYRYLALGSEGMQAERHPKRESNVDN